MEYDTTYLWQDFAEDGPSLSLQQVYHKKKKLPVVFACMGWAAEELTDWFYAVGLSLCLRKGEAGMYDLGHKLYRQLRRSIRKQKKENPESLTGESSSFIGILGVGRRLCIFSLGEAALRVRVLHSGGVPGRELPFPERDGQAVGIQYATMDKGTGVLLERKGIRDRKDSAGCVNAVSLVGK